MVSVSLHLHSTKTILRAQRVVPGDQGAHMVVFLSVATAIVAVEVIVAGAVGEVEETEVSIILRITGVRATTMRHPSTPVMAVAGTKEERRHLECEGHQSHRHHNLRMACHSTHPTSMLHSSFNREEVVIEHPPLLKATRTDMEGEVVINREVNNQVAITKEATNKAATNKEVTSKEVTSKEDTNRAVIKEVSSTTIEVATSRMATLVGSNVGHMADTDTIRQRICARMLETG